MTLSELFRSNMNWRCDSELKIINENGETLYEGDYEGMFNEKWNERYDLKEVFWFRDETVSLIIDKEDK